MKTKKKEKIIIKLTVDEALKIISDFGKLKGMTDDMCIMELIERLHMLT